MGNVVHHTGFNSQYDKRIEELEARDRLRNELISDALLDEVSNTRKTNTSLVVKVAKLESQLKSINTQHELEVLKLIKSYDDKILNIEKKHSKDLEDVSKKHSHGLKVSLGKKRVAELDIVGLNKDIANKQYEVNVLNNDIVEKDKVIIELKTANDALKEIIEHNKLESKKTQLILDNLDKVIFEVTGVNDFIGQFKETGIDGDVITKLIDIVMSNKNYLIRGTTGKKVINDAEKMVSMCIDVIEADGVCKVAIAEKYSITKNDLYSKIKTCKTNRLYDLVSMYLKVGITDELVSVYEEDFRDIIDILRKRT